VGRIYTAEELRPVADIGKGISLFFETRYLRNLLITDPAPFTTDDILLTSFAITVDSSSAFRGVQVTPAQTDKHATSISAMHLPRRDRETTRSFHSQWDMTTVFDAVQSAKSPSKGRHSPYTLVYDAVLDHRRGEVRDVLLLARAGQAADRALAAFFDAHGWKNYFWDALVFLALPTSVPDNFLVNMPRLRSFRFNVDHESDLGSSLRATVAAIKPCATCTVETEGLRAYDAPAFDIVVDDDAHVDLAHRLTAVARLLPLVRPRGKVFLQGVAPGLVTRASLQAAATSANLTLPDIRSVHTFKNPPGFRNANHTAVVDLV
jgi:hypothetical protein